MPGGGEIMGVFSGQLSCGCLSLLLLLLPFLRSVDIALDLRILKGLINLLDYLGIWFPPLRTYGLVEVVVLVVPMSLAADTVLCWSVNVLPGC